DGRHDPAVGIDPVDDRLRAADLFVVLGTASTTAWRTLARVAVFGQQLGHRALWLLRFAFSTHRLHRAPYWALRPVTSVGSATESVAGSAPSVWSRRRRITSSRSAHGQSSSSLRSSARMVASATNAPATTWWERFALTPSSSARSAEDIRETNVISCRRPVSVSTLRALGPREEGAAPVSRASERNVLEVATVRSGGPILVILRATLPSSSASHSRSS